MENPAAAARRSNPAACAFELAENRPHFVASEHGGPVSEAFRANDLVQPRKILPQDLSIEKQQRVEGLVLRRCRDLAVNRQRREELRDFGGAQLGRMTLSVEESVRWL